MKMEWYELRDEENKSVWASASRKEDLLHAYQELRRRGLAKGRMVVHKMETFSRILDVWGSDE